SHRCCRCVVCLFFQAEDGIRDFHVTGVQTCALPISTLVQVLHKFQVATNYSHHTRLLQTRIPYLKRYRSVKKPCSASSGCDYNASARLVLPYCWVIDKRTSEPIVVPFLLRSRLFLRLNSEQQEAYPWLTKKQH